VRIFALWGVGLPALVEAVAGLRWALAAGRGDTIARRGERLPGLFIVAHGLVKLALHGAENEERVLRLVGAGQSFGEATALLGRAARYEARALREAKLVVVPAAPLFALRDREPRFGRARVHLLTERNLELLAELEAASLQRSAQRLASYLHSLANGGAERSVRLPVSKTVLAARLGVTKETLSRLLRRFAADGLIAVSRADIALLDRPGLERRASAP
jgi:CRP/FNR family transcriptional regulator, dissimilatory nitrate respiration regulator